jgi:predicted small metal-binding protein
VSVTHKPRERDPALCPGQLTCQLNPCGSHDEGSTQLHDHISDHSEMAKRIVCECGYVIRGENDDQLVELGREHMQANHPAIAAVITAEELLEMAEEE